MDEKEKNKGSGASGRAVNFFALRLAVAAYLVYRHFAAGDPEEAGRRLRFCFFAAQLVCALDPLSADALRLFSAEIEYSDENVEKLCAWLIAR